MADSPKQIYLGIAKGMYKHRLIYMYKFVYMDVNASHFPYFKNHMIYVLYG